MSDLILKLRLGDPADLEVLRCALDSYLVEAALCEAEARALGDNQYAEMYRFHIRRTEHLLNILPQRPED